MTPDAGASAGASTTMTNSLSGGWRRLIWGILGQLIALVAHIVLVAAGLGVLVANSPLLFDVIRYVGAAHLVMLGVRQWRSRKQLADGDPSTNRAESPAATVRRGLLVNVTNPKDVIFFLALTLQFTRADRAIAPQYRVLTATAPSTS